MFSTISSYLFGSSETQEEVTAMEEEGPSTTSNNPASAEAKHCRLKETHAEEEWVLVDKSRGSSLERMEQNPLENLLIEHPSMSVYGPRLRQNSAGIESDQSESSSTDDLPAHTRHIATRRRAVPVRSSPRRPRAVAARAGLSTNQQTIKAAQVSQRRNSKRQLSANQLTRSNKVRQVESRGVRQRHIPLLMQPGSRASKRC